VTNPAPTTGGTHTETPKVTKADVDAAMAALVTKLQDALGQRIVAADGVPAGLTVLPDTKRLGEATPTVAPASLIDSQVADFQLGLTASGSVAAVDTSQVAALAEGRLRDKVAPGSALVQGSVKVDVSTPIVAGDAISFSARVRGTQVRTLDRATILARILGLGLPQARSVLAEYGDATVNAWPDWVTTIPTSEARVTFTIDPGPSSSPVPGAPTVVP
jgi:hypothetical protein